MPAFRELSKEDIDEITEAARMDNFAATLPRDETQRLARKDRFAEYLWAVDGEDSRRRPAAAGQTSGGQAAVELTVWSEACNAMVRNHVQGECALGNEEAVNKIAMKAAGRLKAMMNSRELEKARRLLRLAEGNFSAVYTDAMQKRYGSRICMACGTNRGCREERMPELA